MRRCRPRHRRIGKRIHRAILVGEAKVLSVAAALAFDGLAAKAAKAAKAVAQKMDLARIGLILFPKIRRRNSSKTTERHEELAERSVAE